VWDGRGRWRDKVFVKRLWRSVKYEEVYLHHRPGRPLARQVIRTQMLLLP